jgi:hypothetical protein
VMGKLWEVAIVLIALSLASKLFVANLAPLLPALIVVLVLCGIGGFVYSKKQRW